MKRLGLFALVLILGGCQKSCSVHQEAQMNDPSALQIAEIALGDGAEAVSGKTLVVHYTGKIKGGAQFDSSRSRNLPLTFELGAGLVIPGWDEGLQGMKVGGKRMLTVPPALAYGENGAGGMIPPNATLEFEVELLEVR